MAEKTETVNSVHIIIFQNRSFMLLIFLCSEDLTALLVHAALIHPVVGRIYANKDCLLNSDILCS